MADSREIHNLLHDEHIDSLLNQYTQASWEYLNDNNNLAYAQGGYIQFDGTPMKDKFITWHDAYIMLPLTLGTSTATAYTGPLQGTKYGVTGGVDVLAIKGSILNLISDIVVTDTRGKAILNESNASWIACIRQALEHSRDWAESESQESMFGLDTTTASATQATQLPLTIAGGFATTATIQGNFGFLKRLDDFAAQAKFFPNGGSGYYELNACIRLADLHDFFSQMDFPIVNFPMIFKFGTNFVNCPAVTGVAGVPAGYVPGNYPPFMNGIAAVNGVDTAPPAIKIGNSTATACRLYYKAVTFNAMDSQKIQEKISHGFSKTIDFVTTEWFNPVSAYNSTAAFSTLITSSAIRPLRLYVLGYPNLAIGLTNNPGIMTPSAVLTNVNVKINNENYFNSLLQLPKEFFDQVKGVMLGYGVSNELGSMMSYDNWLKSTPIYVFDISRVQSRIRSPNDSVSVSIQLQNSNGACGAYARPVGSNTSTDYYFLIEKQTAIRFDFSSSDVRTVVGIGA